MTERFFQQAENLFKPIADFMALNQATLETLANKQSALVSGLWNEGVTYAQKIIEEKNGNYLELQKSYLESVNQKINEATQSSVDLLAATQSKFSDLFQESLLGGAIIEAARNVTEPVEPAKTAEAKMAQAVKVAAEVALTPPVKIKSAVEAKPKIPAKAGGKKVGGDEASVENAIRSIMSERN